MCIRDRYGCAQTRKFLSCHLVHAARRARSPNLKMMKCHSRLNHGLQEEFLFWPDLAHPTFFPGIMRSMEFAGVIQINPCDVFDWIGGYVCVRIRRSIT